MPNDQGARLYIDPCIPRAWRGFHIDFRYHSARYEVSVENPHGLTRGVSLIEVDGMVLTHVSGVSLVDDGETHIVRVVLG